MPSDKRQNKAPAKEAKTTALATRIKAVRKHYKLSQQRFAERIGVSRSYLSEVEGQKGKPSVEMMLGIADHFPDIRADWLLTGESKMLAGEADTVFGVEPVSSSVIKLAFRIAAAAAAESGRSLSLEQTAQVSIPLMEVIRIAEGARQSGETAPAYEVIEKAMVEARRIVRDVLPHYVETDC